MADARTGASGAEAPPAPPLPRARKPALVRRLGRVDAEPLALQVDRLSERVWDAEDRAKPNRHECFNHTRHIVFRFPLPGDDPRRFQSMPGWRVWRAWLLPPMRRAAAAYGFSRPEYPKVMLARLAAGRDIGTHLDVAGRDPFVHKVHVPLRTDPKAASTVNDRRLHLAAGYAWEINNLVPHGACNGAKRDRIHLVFEVFDDAEPVGGAATAIPRARAAPRRPGDVPSAEGPG